MYHKSKDWSFGAYLQSHLASGNDLYLPDQEFARLAVTKEALLPRCRILGVAKPATLKTFNTLL
jgi:hypothetical protein